jgi:hypothetical protein
VANAAASLTGMPGVSHKIVRKWNTEILDRPTMPFKQLSSKHNNYGAQDSRFGFLLPVRLVFPDAKACHYGRPICSKVKVFLKNT